MGSRKEMKTKMDFEIYLGANTPEGFYSYFEDFVAQVPKLYIIKGGPGSGKSTMMKKIARFGENAGVRTVWIYCSSDSDSLDGVFFPDYGIMYVDGTAPHALEAKTPGAREELIDFGQCFDTAGLGGIAEEIELENELLRVCYAQCYAYLNAAKNIKARIDEQYAPPCALLISRAQRLARRTIGVHRGAAPGKRYDIFLSSFTKNGLEKRNIPDDYQFFPIYDPYSCCGCLMETLAACAVENGCDVYAAHDPYAPDADALHVLVPQLRLAFVSTGRPFGYEDAPGRHLRFDAPDTGADSAEKERRRRDTKLLRALEACAADALTRAKAVHDRLEALYHPFVDFTKADEITKTQFEMLASVFASN